ncbi:uncharacterized protein LOC144113896 isoform X2 [Amblyomma americanum]
MHGSTKSIPLTTESSAATGFSGPSTVSPLASFRSTTPRCLVVRSRRPGQHISQGHLFAGNKA